MTHPDDSPSEWVPFGYVARSHGVRGAMRVIPYDGVAAWPQEAGWARLQPTKRAASTVPPAEVQLPASSEGCQVREARNIHGAVLLTVAEVPHREAAHGLRGWEVQVAAQALPELEDDEVYLHELVGAQALAPDGTVLGEVTGVTQAGPQDLLVLNTSAGERLVPMVPEFFRDYDPEARRVVLDCPEGLL